MRVSEVDALLSCLKEEEERQDVRVAKIVYAVFRAQGCKIDGRDVELMDFLPKEPLSEEQEQALNKAKMRFFEARNKVKRLGAK